MSTKKKTKICTPTQDFRGGWSLNIKGNDKKSFAVTSRQTAGICKHPDRVYVIEYEE